MRPVPSDESARGQEHVAGRTSHRGARAAARARRERRLHRDAAGRRSTAASRSAFARPRHASDSPLLLGPPHAIARRAPRSASISIVVASETAASPRRNTSCSMRRRCTPSCDQRLGLGRGADPRAAEPDRVVPRLVGAAAPVDRPPAGRAGARSPRSTGRRQRQARTKIDRTDERPSVANYASLQTR